MATASAEQGFDRRLARVLREGRTQRRELAMGSGSATALAADVEAFLDMLDADGLLEETDNADDEIEFPTARFARRVLLRKNQYINVEKTIRLNKVFEAERQFLEGASKIVLQAHNTLKQLRANYFDEQPSLPAEIEEDSVHEDELLSVMRMIREDTRSKVDRLLFSTRSVEIGSRPGLEEQMPRFAHVLLLDFLDVCNLPNEAEMLMLTDACDITNVSITREWFATQQVHGVWDLE